MPGIGIHLSVLDEVTDALRTSNNPVDKKHFNVLNRFPEFAALGAVGPDIGFFLGFSFQPTA